MVISAGRPHAPVHTTRPLQLTQTHTHFSLLHNPLGSNSDQLILTHTQELKLFLYTRRLVEGLLKTSMQNRGVVVGLSHLTLYSGAICCVYSSLDHHPSVAPTSFQSNSTSEASDEYSGMPIEVAFVLVILLLLCGMCSIYCKTPVISNDDNDISGHDDGETE